MRRGEGGTGCSYRGPHLRSRRPSRKMIIHKSLPVSYGQAIPSRQPETQLHGRQRVVAVAEGSGGGGKWGG